MVQPYAHLNVPQLAAWCDAQRRGVRDTANRLYGPAVLRWLREPIEPLTSGGRSAGPRSMFGL